MFVNDKCCQLVCVTCRLSCLDEELLLLRDSEDIFCDMAELRSSEPISLQTGWGRLRLESQDHSSTERNKVVEMGSGQERVEREGEKGFQRQAL